METGNLYTSKAISAAIKALQEKVKKSQNDNTVLSEKLLGMEQKMLKNELEYDRLYRDKVKDNKHFKSTAEELSRQIKNLEQESQGAKQDRNLYKNQSDFYESENQRILQEFKVEKGGTLRDLQLLKQEKTSACLSEKNLRSSLSAGQQEVRKLKGKLNELKQATDLLTTELEISTSSVEKQKTESEGIIRQLEQANLNYRQQISAIEQKNSELNQINIGKDKEINVLNYQLNEIKKETHIAEQTRITLKKQYQDTQNFCKDLVDTNERLVCSLRNQQKSAIHRKKSLKSKSKMAQLRSKSVRRSGELQIEDLAANRFERDAKQLTEEVAELNMKYKSLLQVSFLNSGDWNSIRGKLNNLASLIEEKSEEMHNLKKKHHREMREKIVRFKDC